MSFMRYFFQYSRHDLAICKFPALRSTVIAKQREYYNIDFGPVAKSVQI